jgi:hypothetical protein
MLNPQRLVNDLFDDNDLSDPMLRAFSDDHMLRLQNNNPGNIYDPLIADTTAAYTSYYGSMVSEETKESVTEGLTIAMNNARDAVLKDIANLQDLVIYKFGQDSSEYQEFFPLGMDEYYQARLDDLTTILDRFETAANLHLNVDHAGEVAEVSGLIADYKTARQNQKDAFSETDTLRTERRENRKVLTMQLTKNFLTLALDFLEDPDRYDDYYDPQYLPLRSGGGDDDDGDDSGGDDDDNDTTSVSITGLVTYPDLTPASGARVYVLGPDGEELFEVFTNDSGTYELIIPEEAELPEDGVEITVEADKDGAIGSANIFVVPGNSYEVNIEITV